MSRIGKIARLPHRVREELNRRLREGEKARVLVDWLNGLPVVRAIVKAEFEGRDIREQNVSEWRKGGYRDWLAQRVALEEGSELSEQVAEMVCKSKAPVTDQLAAYLSAHYAVALKRAVRQGAGGSVDLKTLQALCADVVALRRADQNAQRLTLERKRFKLEAQHSLVRWKKKMRFELDELLSYLDHSDPRMKAAFAGFFKRWRHWTEDEAEEHKEHPMESIGPWLGVELPGPGSAPGKSGELPPPPAKSGKA